MRLKELPKSSAQIQIEKLFGEVEQLKTALIQKDNTIQSLQNQLTAQANTGIKSSNQLKAQKQTLDLKNLECDTLAKTITDKDLIISENQNTITQLQNQLRTQTQLTQEYNTQLIQAKTDLRIKELEEQVEKLNLTVNLKNCNTMLSFIDDEFGNKQKLDIDIKNIQNEFTTKISSLKFNHSFSTPSFPPIEQSNKLINNELKKINDIVNNSDLKKLNTDPEIKSIIWKQTTKGMNSFEYVIDNQYNENSHTELIGNSEHVN